MLASKYFIFLTVTLEAPRKYSWLYCSLTFKSSILNTTILTHFLAVTIAEYLESDPPIRHIDLDHIRLNDDDIILISQALKRNTNLKSAYLHSNNFTSIGMKALLMCAFDSSSLNDITESNHTLSGTYFFDGTFKRLAYCIDRLLELDRTQKIILALQDKDSLLQYLANIPVELIPEVWHFLFGVMPIHVSTNI